MANSLDIYTIVLGAIVLAAAYTLTIYVQYKAKRRQYHFPPGPRGWPIVGNLFQLPGVDAGRKANEWRDEYGEL